MRYRRLVKIRKGEMDMPVNLEKKDKNNKNK